METEGCTVILPTYNEEANIGKMVRTIREMYPEFNVLVMDDNSKDGTRSAVEALMKSDGNVRFITRDINDKGLSASIFHGIMESQTEFFINMDSDFQHPPSALGPIYNELKKGNDLVIGVRKDRTALSSVFRWISSWIAHFMSCFTLKFMGKQVSSDVMSGLFGGRTALFKHIIEKNLDKFEIRGFKALFDLMKYVPSDIKMTEVAFDFGEREGGESKISSGIIFSIFRQCGRLGKFIASVGKNIKK